MHSDGRWMQVDGREIQLAYGVDLLLRLASKSFLALPSLHTHERTKKKDEINA